MDNLPHKTYLNGADCFHLMLERNIKKYKTGNNIIRMVMTVNNEEALERITNNIQNSPIINWIANIDLKQPFLFNPYWKYVNKNKRIPLLSIDGNFRQIPHEILNDNFSLNKGPLVRFHQYKTTENQIKLVFSFHHVLLDGRGSGLLIKHLTSESSTLEIDFNTVFPKQIKRINFVSHVINMFRVKKFVEHSMRKPIAHPPQSHSSNIKYFLSVKDFTQSETHVIETNAKNQGARFGTNLFQIACCAHAVNLFTGSNNDLWLPVPYDGRKRGSHGPIISNNISFLFYRISLANNPTISDTVKEIYDQMSHQLKLEIPRKYNELLQFMKFIPKRFYYWMTTSAGKGAISSFLYSSSGEASWDTSHFSEDLSDILLIPPFTYPPGVSITFLRYKGQLKMNIAVANNKIDENNLSLLEDKLVELLLLKNN